MKDKQTYSKINTTGILLLFLVCFCADVQSQNNGYSLKYAKLDLNQDQSELNTLAIAPTVAKTNSFPVFFNLVTKRQDVFISFGTMQEHKGVQLSSKVGLFILYSTLKIAPIL